MWNYIATFFIWNKVLCYGKVFEWLEYIFVLVKIISIMSQEVLLMKKGDKY